MKHRITGLAGVLALGFAVPAAAQETIEIHNTMSPDGSEEAAIERFKEEVEARSDGRFEVTIYMGGQLGDETEVLELLNLGQTQMALTGGAFMNQYTPEFDAISVPFLLPSWEAVEAYMETESGLQLQELAREQGGILYFGPQKRAFRHMTSNREIHGPDDLEGLSMRLPEIPVWVDVWESLGVQPVVIPAPDIYLAMQTGQVEAHENSLASPYTRQMWEVQDYIIETNHLSFPWHWVASESWFDGLSDEDQAMIAEAAEVARQYGTEQELEMDAYYREALMENGMEFIEVDPAEFADAAAPAIEAVVEGFADGVAEDIQAVLDATQ